MARPARIFLAAELLLGIAYFLLPDSLLRAVVYCTLGLGMVVAVVVGTRLHRPAQPLAWYLLAGGQLSFTVGDAINYTYQWVLEVEPPHPSVADGFYLACYALLAGGLLLLVRERAPGRDLASLIDATIITVGVGLLSWVFLIGPNVRAPDLLLSQRLVSIAYPLCDVLLVAVAVRMCRNCLIQPGQELRLGAGLRAGCRHATTWRSCSPTITCWTRSSRRSTAAASGSASAG